MLDSRSMDRPEIVTNLDRRSGERASTGASVSASHSARPDDDARGATMSFARVFMSASLYATDWRLPIP